MSNAGNHGRYVWHELMTSDLAAAEKFYAHVMGWVAAPWQSDEMPGVYTLCMAGETPVAGIMAMSAQTSAPGSVPSWLAYVEVDDIDTTVDQALSLGAEVVVPARTVPSVGRFAALKDPQGTVFGAITSETQLPPETDPEALGFSWHELATTDWQAASEFYSAIFGWKKQSEFDMGDMGKYYMYGRDRFTYGGMMNKMPGDDTPARWVHYVQVADSADAAAGRATAAGATLVVGPMEVPGGDRVAVLIDPQGAGFAVHSKPAK